MTNSVNTEVQQKLTKALSALYLEVPATVAQGVYEAVLAVVNEQTDKLLSLQGLANEAIGKGRDLQLVPELRLTGNAYVGMGQRILEIIGEDNA